MYPEEDMADDDGGEQPPSDMLEARGPDQSNLRLYAIKIENPQLQAWILQIVDQDQQAFSALYGAMVGKVYGLVNRITRNPQLAEEVTEDVFWQIWRQAPRFDPARGVAGAWIMTMARSRALDALRRRESCEEIDSEAVALAEAEGEGNPLDLLAVVERDTQVHQALDAIAPLPRQLVALAFFKGLSHEEIATHTGLPLGTVKSQIRRALIKLKELLGGLSPMEAMTS